MVDAGRFRRIAVTVSYRSPALPRSTRGRGSQRSAAVVILTMLASMSFDPRLIWDAAEIGIPRNGVNGDRTDEAGKTGDGGKPFTWPNQCRHLKGAAKRIGFLH